MNRREFIRHAAGISGAIVTPALAGDRGPATAAAPSAQVAFVKTRDRAAGVVRAIDLLGIGRFDGKDLFVKPNFNSADMAPGSTHEDTLAALLRKLRAIGAGPLTIGDRSGMGDTREVMAAKGVFRLAKEFDARAVVLDELKADDWEPITLPDSHWHVDSHCHEWCARRARGADVLPEDPPLRRPFHVVAQEFGRPRGEVHPRQSARHHARAAHFAASAPDDCRDQRGISSRIGRARRRAGVRDRWPRYRQAGRCGRRAGISTCRTPTSKKPNDGINIHQVRLQYWFQ